MRWSFGRYNPLHVLIKRWTNLFNAELSSGFNETLELRLVIEF